MGNRHRSSRTRSYPKPQACRSVIKAKGPAGGGRDCQRTWCATTTGTWRYGYFVILEKFSSHVPAELPGSRPAIQLASSTRGFTLQHITDRLNLICAQHNLGLPSKTVATLMSLAYEVSAR